MKSRKARERGSDLTKKALAKLGLQGDLPLSLRAVSLLFWLGACRSVRCLASEAAGGQQAGGPDFLQVGKKSDSPEEGGRVTQSMETLV